MNDTTGSDPQDGDRTTRRTWLLLIHRIPPEPAYFRVKVRRRLRRIGAIALKNSVYVLPSGEEALEDLVWTRQEIEREGGEATVCEAVFLEAAAERRLIEEFRVVREAEYRAVVEEATSLLERVGEEASEERATARARATVAKLERRLDGLAAADSFGAEGRDVAKRVVARVADALRGGVSAESGRWPGEASRPTGRVWVTRAGVKEDRIGSAWLIRRFIDPAARFRFVPSRGYEPVRGEIRFDMFEGEYTHEGESCTFEVLLQRCDLRHDPALVQLAEIIHDIDAKDDKYGRAETAGVASLIGGIVRAHAEDEVRLERGMAMLDDLYAQFASGG